MPSRLANYPFKAFKQSIILFEDKEKRFFLTSFFGDIAPESIGKSKFIQMTKKSHCVPGCEQCVKFTDLEPKKVDIDVQVSAAHLKAGYKRHTTIEVTKCVKCQANLFENYATNSCCHDPEEKCKSCDLKSFRCQVCGPKFEMKPSGVCELSPKIKAVLK